MSVSSAIIRAQAAWGEETPDWILELAKACNNSSQNKVAKKIGYSAAVVSTVLSNCYKGDYDTVRKAVKGAFMKETVGCPVLGDIPGNECLDIQKRPFSRANQTRLKLYRACRNNCPHSQIS